MTRDEKLYQSKLTKIQNDVVNRLYYRSKKFNNYLYNIKQFFILSI
jgi:hypothetical protein